MPIASCCACGSRNLSPHLTVGGEAGEQGLIPTTDAFGTALSDIVRCGACGHMQLERMPAEPELSEAYGAAASSDYLAEEEGQRETARRLLARIESHVAPGRLLDVGAWVGFFMAEAAKRGWDATGIEPSAFAAAHARDALGLEVIEGGLDDAELPTTHFRCVFMGDVIEHLPEPGAALGRIGAILEPGGVLALALPDAGSRLARRMGTRWWSVIPTHVQYFTRPSVTRLLEGHGFEVLEIRTAPKAFSVRYYLGRTAGYSPGLARGLVRAAETLGAADRQWAPDFRDRMFVIARPKNRRIR